jgi:hypothetical protein
LTEIFAVEQQRIRDNQAIIKQMDDAVNNLLTGSATNATKDNNRTETPTKAATKLRESQKKEKTDLRLTKLLMIPISVLQS